MIAKSCAAEVSHSNTWEVYHLKKDGRVTNSAILGARQDELPLTLAGEDLVKNKEGLTDKKLFMKMACKRNHKISLLYLENFRIYRASYI